MTFATHQPAPSVATSHVAMLDALLHEVERGRAGHAVLLLAGMLDAAHDRTGLSLWREALRQHPINAFLAPLCAEPDDADARQRHDAMLSQSDLPPDTALGMRRLHNAMAPLGFVRGLRARHDLTRRTIEQKAGRNGDGRRTIALINDPQMRTGFLPDGADTTVILADHWRDLCAFAGRSGRRRFDLILAPALPDAMEAGRLTEAMRALSGHLATGGVLTISAFAPAHLGLGWQAALMGGAPQCHDETALGKAARAAALTLHHRRDASNTLIWADMRVVAGKPATGGPA